MRHAFSLLLLCLPGPAYAQQPDTVQTTRPLLDSAATEGLPRPGVLRGVPVRGVAPGQTLRCDLGCDDGPRLRVLVSVDSVGAGASSVRRFHPARFYVGLGAAAAADLGVVVGLSGLWYAGDRVPFHWFSDSAPNGPAKPKPAWVDDLYTDAQMDKGGHLVTAWQITRVAGAYARWSGLSDRRAALAGGLFALAFQSQIELFDGFDPLYGASRTDLLANLAGAAVGAVQVAHPARTDWFTAKVSYHPTHFYKDDLTPIPPLTFIGNGIKDYEGLSYWFVVRPARLGAPSWWPRWLGASLGYGADGLSGLAPVCCAPDPNVRREVYLSLDLDVLESERDRLPRVLRPVATALSFVRLPMPAYEFGGRGRAWHWLYY